MPRRSRGLGEEHFGLRGEPLIEGVPRGWKEWVMRMVLGGGAVSKVQDHSLQHHTIWGPADYPPSTQAKCEHPDTHKPVSFITLLFQCSNNTSSKYSVRTIIFWYSDYSCCKASTEPGCSPCLFGAILSGLLEVQLPRLEVLKILIK